MACEHRIRAWMLGTAACLAVGAGTSAAAAGTGLVYVCTDARGRTLTSDFPPPECGDRPIKELRADGSVRRVIEPPLTAEQRAKRDAEERRKADEENQRRAQARRDRALLEAYSDESEIEEARARAVEGRRVLIDRAGKRMEELQRERKKLDDEAEFYAGRTQPDKLKRAYDSNAAMMQAQRKIIADTDAELNRINERFESERKRFRELVKSGAQPIQRSATATTR